MNDPDPIAVPDAGHERPWYRRPMRLAVTALVLAVVGWAFVSVAVRVGSDPHPDRPIKLTLLQWGDHEETALLQQIVDGYERAHPRVHVTVLPTGNFDGKLSTMTTGGTPPDVFYVADDNLFWANLGMLAPLDEWIARDVQREGDAWLKDFDPYLLEWFRFDGERVRHGPQYALPIWHSGQVMYVNKDLFARAGIPIPYDGWTWAEYEDVIERITALSPGDDAATRIYGGWMGSDQYGLVTLIQNHGAYVFADEGRDESRITLQDPKAIAALELVRRGRFERRTIYTTPGAGFASQGGGTTGLDFASGRIGVQGPARYGVASDLRRERLPFAWDVVPVPHQERKTTSARVGIGWAMAKQSRHPAEAYALLRHLTDVGAQSLLARKGLIVPSRLSVARSDDFLKQAGGPERLDIVVAATLNGSIPHWPPMKQFLGFFFEDLGMAIRSERLTPTEATALITRHWNDLREISRNRTTGPLMPWTALLTVTAGVVVLTLAGAVWWLARRWRKGSAWREELSGLLFISPWLIGLLIFTLGPMLVSLVMSFTLWSPKSPIDQARFIGWANYQEMFTSDEYFAHSLWVTLYYTILAVPIGQAVALFLAVLLNACDRGSKTLRTLYFIPSLAGGVVLAALGVWLFNGESGLVNAVLRPLLSPFGLEPPHWLTHDAEYFAVPALVLISLWSVSGPTVIYLAALRGVPKELYEAAHLDGAGPWQRFWRITLPTISPVAQFNLIMALIASFQVFTLAMLISAENKATLFYAVQLYNEGFFGRMGYGCAMAWVLFAIILAITLLAFRVMRRWVHYEALR